MFPNITQQYRYFDIVLLLVILLRTSPLTRKEYSTSDNGLAAVGMDGMSVALDREAFENLNRVVKALFSDNTWVIPSNVQIKGNLEVVGDVKLTSTATAETGDGATPGMTTSVCLSNLGGYNRHGQLGVSTPPDQAREAGKTYKKNNGTIKACTIDLVGDGTSTGDFWASGGYITANGGGVYVKNDKGPGQIWVNKIHRL